MRLLVVTFQDIFINCVNQMNLRLSKLAIIESDLKVISNEDYLIDENIIVTLVLFLS